jgi:hypothetical protein
MRLLIIWMGAAVVVVAATAGLLWWSTESSAQFRVDGGALSVSGQLTLASTERLDRLLEENDGLDDAGAGRHRRRKRRDLAACRRVFWCVARACRPRLQVA